MPLPSFGEFVQASVRSQAANLLFRPWFDRVALAALTRWIFPAGRLWASAEATHFTLQRFLADNPELTRARLPPQMLLRSLGEAHRARNRAMQAEARCDDLTFGGATPDPDRLADAEITRRRAAQAYTATRLRFIYAARRAEVAAVRFAIPSEDEVRAAFARWLAAPAMAFLPQTPLPTVEESPRYRGAFGREYVLRFRSPHAGAADMAWARVFEPDGVADPPTLIHCHGVAIEADNLDLAFDEIMPLIAMGVRVVRPVAPWHGRRRLFGTWSGEPFFTRVPLSALTLLAAIVQELIVLVDWSRRTSRGRVGWSGVSLGALAVQLGAVHLREGPHTWRPDALMLIGTSDRMDRIALEGALTRGLGMDRALRAAGWTDARLEVWRPFTDPLGSPCVAPDRVVIVLGTEDVVTPYQGGVALAERWRVPEANRFDRKQGHFSLALGLLPATDPLRRLAEILAGRG